MVHRWQDRYAHYERYVSHQTHAVTYVTTGVGVPGVPDAAAEIAVVDATDDEPAVLRAVDQLARRHGPPRAVVALNGSTSAEVEKAIHATARDFRIAAESCGPAPLV